MTSDEAKRMAALNSGELVFQLSNGQLILTVPSELLEICDLCPHFHVVIVRNASADRLRELATAIAVLAERVQ
jgi:hypothetical protein